MARKKRWDNAKTDSTELQDSDIENKDDSKDSTDSEKETANDDLKHIPRKYHKFH
jgi:hypothetical protein